MALWKIVLSYDGSDFHGWQVQPGRATVQGTLAAVLEKMTGERVVPQGSGRTDAGVHALGQVASFALEAEIPAENLLRALNRSLPQSVRVLRVDAVAQGFHARHSAVRKTYEYRIFERKAEDLDVEKICPPFVAPYVWDCRWVLDVEAMKRAAAMLCGTHDFTSFAAVDPDLAQRVDGVGPNPVKTIFASEVRREDGLLRYRVTGSGFLHHMVRNIVGTLVEVGRGALRTEEMGENSGGEGPGGGGAYGSAAGTIFGGSGVWGGSMSAANNRRIAALASDRAVHRAFAWLHLHEAQMRRWQMEFLGIAAPPFGEAERAAWFCERFREIGLVGARVDAAGNAVAELRADGAEEQGPVVMLSAHLDTVFPAGTDCAPREDEAKILGPGACDNGAGLTALLGLAAALRHAEIVPSCAIVFAANVGEEGEGDLRGMRHLFAEAPYAGRVKAAIALEGGGDAMVVDRALGSRRLRVTIAGPGGHSWADAGRANPIMALAAALVELGRLRLPARPRTTLNCGVIRGGTSVNSIPEAATADLDLRSVSGMELDRVELGVLETLTRIVDAENQRRGEAALKLHVKRIGDRAAGALAASSGLAMSLKAVDRHLGIATEARIGSTDANLPLSLGVPALAIGAGGLGWGIHTLQEGYDPTGRDLALRRVLLLLLDMCALTAESELAEAGINSGVVRTLVRTWVLVGWGLGFVAGMSALGQAEKARNSVAPDTIFYDGNIFTGTRLKAGDADPTPGRVSAVAVRAGKIVAVGGNAAMLRLKDSHTKTVDLKGSFAMPGFNDAHTHMAPAGRQRLSMDLDNVASLAAMQVRVKAYSAKLEPGEWILGGGWDHTKWAGGKLPTRQDLDAVSAGHPAFLERTDEHIAIANSAALKAANITDYTPNPKGGEIDRDADGQATGILREGPTLTMVEKVIPSPSLAVRRKAIALSMQDALSHGVTSIQDFSDWEDFLAMEEMEHEGTLHLRIAEWLDFNLPIGVLEERRRSHPADDPLLHLTFLKGFMDGSLGSRTAAMNAPYADDPHNYGIARYDQGKLNQMATARAADGFQLGFHAIGDEANDMALNALAAAEQVGRPANVPPVPKNVDAGIVTAAPATVKPQDLRFRIEHAQVVSPGAFERFRELGVIASMQPSHLLTDMAWAEARLGPERVKRAYAWRSFLDHGVTLAFGTDYPVESISPFRGLYAAITRQNVEGTQTFEPQEKITIDEAIYAYTQASAFAEFRETIKGRLEPGYLADMVVLDRDITKASAQEVLHTRVQRTVVGGETVYTAP